MGQPIEITTTVVDDTAIFDTDRSITGQDGALFRSAEEVAGDSFPDRLAQRLFAADPTVGSVFVASNVVTVTRPGGWDEGGLAEAAGVVRDFFVFYRDDALT